MTTANYYVLAEPLKSDRELREEHPWVATEQLSFTRSKIEAEPEARLWKICAEAAPPRLSVFEWIALLVFGVSGIVVLACCVFEWLQLSNSSSLDQIVRALLSK
jgi:hypothetical protein